MKNMYLILFSLFIGCQGMPSKKPPIHLNPNMDNQERFNPQESNSFFDNNMSMRTPPEGTIPRGYLDDNTTLYYGKNNKGDFVDKVSDVINVDELFIRRGQDRYNIYCSVCHGYTGDGNGLVAQNDEYPLIPTSIHSETLDDKTDGYFFDIITNGVRNMPGYSHQINIEDRWAIVAYLKALRLSRESN
tara:strand:- start:521 stop:1084 length:564 start_codon:yes stop_codon:yes gene_type:complete